MVFENVIQQKHCQLELNERKEKIKEGCQTSKIRQAENRLITLLRCKFIYPSGKRKDDSKSGATGPEGEALIHTELLLGLETSWIWPSGFHDGLGLMTSFLLSFYPTVMGTAITALLCPTLCI